MVVPVRRQQTAHSPWWLWYSGGMSGFEDLHIQLEYLVPRESRARSTVRMIVHGLIESGRVTVLQCEYENCIETTRDFIPHSVEDSRYRVDKRMLTVDHIINICDGGTDRPDNLRLMHFSCNSALGGKDPSPERRERLSKAMKTRWKDDEYREKMTESAKNAAQNAEVQLLKAEKMSKRWADPEYRARVAESHRNRETASCEICERVFKNSSGLATHKKTHRQETDN